MASGLDGAGSSLRHRGLGAGLLGSRRCKGVAVDRRLAAILCADVVGFSRLMGADEAGTLGRLKAFEAATIEPLTARHGGRIVKRMGDGYLIAFTSVVAAVEAALAWQAAASPPLAFRIGIHLGDVIIDGDDLYGDGINVAARLEALAEPGGLCLSEDAQRQVRGKLDLALQDLGEQQLKNINQPIRVYRLAGGDGTAPSPAGPAGTSSYRLPKVLLAPFRPLGAASDTAALADGVTETLAAALTHFEEFELIDPGSVQALVAEHGARAAGRQLGATYVLEGTLQLAASKVRIGVQLIDAPSGRRVWSETFDREALDVFALQDEITAIVASTLGEAVGEEQAKAIADMPDDALDAHELQVRGLQHLHRLTREDVSDARRSFERALELAPEQYFLTLCLCWTYAAELGSGWPSPRTDALDYCLALMRDVVRRHDRSAQAHRLMARLAALQGDYTEAVAQAERACVLNPFNSDMMINKAIIIARVGRASEAVPLAERALAVNPYAPAHYKVHLAFVCFLAGEPEKALAALRTVQATIGQSRVIRIASLAALGQVAEAQAEALQLRGRRPT